MNWYEKLNHYFPVEEMKSQEHMQLLLQEKGDIYRKDEGPNHVMLYAETPSFIFVDYLLVSSRARGQGLGHRLLEKLKRKGKPIILEVEPIDYRDSDTERRQHFYEREGFKHAQAIGYRRRSLATDQINRLEILYWSPFDEDEAGIYKKMKKVYDEIHTYKDEDIYGEPYEDVDKVLTFKGGRTSSPSERQLIKTKH